MHKNSDKKPSEDSKLPGVIVVLLIMFCILGFWGTIAVLTVLAIISYLHKHPEIVSKIMNNIDGTKKSR